jgi:hypothetical protein
MFVYLLTLGIDSVYRVYIYIYIYIYIYKDDRGITHKTSALVAAVL